MEDENPNPPSTSTDPEDIQPTFKESAPPPDPAEEAASVGKSSIPDPAEGAAPVRKSSIPDPAEGAAPVKKFSILDPAEGAAPVRKSSIPETFLKTKRASIVLQQHTDLIFKTISDEPEDPVDKSQVPFWCSQRWLMANLAFCGYAMLYAQRVNLSLAIVSMVKHKQEDMSLINGSAADLECGREEQNKTSTEPPGEFDWDKKTQGLILGSFYVGYLVLQVVGGNMSERFGAKRVIAAGMIPVALFTLLTPVAARLNCWVLICVRFLMGCGESVYYPSISALWAVWAPPAERSRLYGFALAGGQFGNAMVFPVSGLLSKYGFDGGWPSVFYVIGGVAGIWCCLWCVFAADNPSSCTRISDIEKEYILAALGNRSKLKLPAGVPWKAVFSSGAMWAIIVGHTCGNYGIYLLLNQIPTYLKEVLKFDIKSNGFISMLPYLAFWFAITMAGLLSDFIISKSYLTIGSTRKLMSFIGLVPPAFFLVGTGYMDCNQAGAAVVMLTLSVGFCGFHFCGHFINHNDIAPPYAGTLFGISNTFATFPGFLAPTITSALTPDGTQGEWQIAFYVAAAIYVFGAIYFMVFGRGEIQRWAMPQEENNPLPESESLYMDSVDGP